MWSSTKSSLHGAGCLLMFPGSESDFNWCTVFLLLPSCWLAMANCNISDMNLKSFFSYSFRAVHLKILKDFGFLFIFYSVDGDISQKATLIELLFVLLNYWSFVLFSLIFFIIIYFNIIYFNVFFCLFWRLC
jgi:hypothetical protein